MSPAYPSPVERDLRETAVFRHVHGFYRSVLEPGFGRITGAGEVEPSPDGRWVAFRGDVLEALEGRERARICLAATTGAAIARIVTNGPNDDAEPRWSPDGAHLSFRSDRRSAGRFELYTLRSGEPAEARALGSVPGSVEHHRWSPDGSHILLVAAGGRAEQADALGSGTLGERAHLPEWIPEVESAEDREVWRRL
jgi:dipeptidyl aminopeptidase/acylaminoacyl peptidase